MSSEAGLCMLVSTVLFLSFCKINVDKLSTMKRMMFMINIEQGLANVLITIQGSLPTCQCIFLTSH